MIALAKPTTATSRRKALEKLLYNAARYATDPYWRGDMEKVKEVRDIACGQLYGKPHEKLTENELESVISHLQPPQPVTKKIVASPGQVKTLRFYALVCAIHYCNLDGLACKSISDGYEYKGELLRGWLKEKFESPGSMLPNSAFSHLHKCWINPRAHKFLEEGNFRMFTKTPERLYYYYLEPEEAQYLINRFRAIAENISMSITLDDFLQNVSNN